MCISLFARHLSGSGRCFHGMVTQLATNFCEMRWPKQSQSVSLYVPLLKTFLERENNKKKVKNKIINKRDGENCFIQLLNWI